MIVGRLSDLGMRELFKLLASAEAEGRLRVETPAGHAELLVRAGEVSGPMTPPLAVAFATRTGSFTFRPEPVEGDTWIAAAEFLALIEAKAGSGWGVVAADTVAGGTAAELDPLGELRESLADVPLPQPAARVLVVTADPRPYRALEAAWRHRGWGAVLVQEPRWPAEPPDVLVLHLPSSGTLAGQGAAWVDLVRAACAQAPPVPVLWVGGMADPDLRHQVVMAGASFLLPAPIGEVGEAARWFRDEVTFVIERLLSPKTTAAESAAEAFRDFFLALHVDSSPAELRASLLRVAATSYARGVLLAVRQKGFEVLGGFGLGRASGVRLARGVGILEGVVAARRSLRCAELDAGQRESMAAVLPGGCAEDGELLPLLDGAECVGVFVGDGLRRPNESTAALAMLLARSGAVVAG